MSIYTPFTYLITHIPTGKRYYGVRYRKGCHPSDIGTKYFSSSKVIKKMIAEDGLDKFKFEVRRTFANADKAIDWEVRVLTRLRVWENDTWLNQSVGGKTFGTLGRQVSEQTRLKLSKVHKGKVISEELKKQWSETHKKRLEDPLVREKIAKKYHSLTEEEKILRRKKTSESLKGTRKSKEHVEKVALAHRGQKRSPEACKRISEGRRKALKKPV